MSQKEKKWFRSAFTDDESPPPTKVLRSSSNASIDLTQDDSFDGVAFLTPNKSHKSDKTIQTVTGTNSSNWLEYFAPLAATDLAVHSKKISEVQDWFRHYELSKKKFPGQILLISGPAGAGKTATVKVVATELKYEIVEWINPVDIDLDRNQVSLGDDHFTYRESQLEMFKQFLFKSSRYRSVFETMQRRLVLVKDFPNMLVRDSEGFEEILQNYRLSGKSPLIFIVTDSKSKQLNLSYTLFPDSIKGKYSIAHICFNPISSTLIKKALTRICNIVQQENFNKLYKIPGADIVESINLASQGDIRNAIINLGFASLRGAPNLRTVSSTKASKTTKKLKTKSLKSVGRDESITLMHALGRVFNPKYEVNGNLQKFTHAPEDIASAFSSEPKMFVNFLHANYLAHFQSVDALLLAADILSRSDQLMTEYREDILGSVGLNIAIRGMMVANRNPVAGWIPVRGYKRPDTKTALEKELERLDVKHELSRNVLVSDYRTYAKIIKQIK